MKTRTKATPAAAVHPGEQPKKRDPKTGGVVPRDVYDRAVEAWCAEGSIFAIRKATGLDVTVATRLLDTGEPRLALPSLRDVARARAAELMKRKEAESVQDAKAQAAEHAKALGARLQATKKAREHQTKVLGDATASRNEEVNLVRANRLSSLALAQVNASLLKTSLALASSLEGIDPAKLSLKEKLGLIRTVAGVVQRTAQASSASVQMERLLMGEPTHILGRADTPMGEMSEDDAEMWIEIASTALARRKARAALRAPKVIDATAVEEDAVDELVEGLT